jgi:hypothetical protein
MTETSPESAPVKIPNLVSWCIWDESLMALSPTMAKARLGLASSYQNLNLNSSKSLFPNIS